MGESLIQFGTGTTVRDFATYGEWLRVAEDCGYELLTAAVDPRGSDRALRGQAV